MNTFFRYEKIDQCLGVVASCESNVIYINKVIIKNFEKIGHFTICGALENVLIWDLKKGDILLSLSGEKSSVSRVAYHNVQMIASGYCDGTIRIWDLSNHGSPLLFKGHTSSISFIDFNQSCSYLVSGSLDTLITIWDIINECGLYKLKGHSGPITTCYFMTTSNVLISSSKDTYIKFWDLETQHCFATLLGHDSEIWDFKLFENETILISCTSSDELRLWTLKNNLDIYTGKRLSESTPSTVPIESYQAGIVLKKNLGRCKLIKMSPSSTRLALLTSKQFIEVFSINPIEDKTIDSNLPSRFNSLYSFKIEDIYSMDLIFDEISDDIYITALLKVNCLQFIKVSNDGTMKKICSINNAGHRSPPLCIQLNYNSSFFCSASSTEIKLWNLDNQQCFRTIQSPDHLLAILYLPGDKFLVAATKVGSLCVFNMSNGELIDIIEAHSASIWTLGLHPNEDAFFSCSSDKTLKFWTFSLKSNIVNLIHQRTLEMDEDVLCAVYSSDGKYIAVGMIDSNVKVFFNDTLKYYLTLYGHKLPINSIDISSDNQFIITGSGDKNIKIWGMDFGDIRKSIFAHNSPVNRVKFVPHTHLFFSCGDDGLVKYWDADTFTLIQELDGHKDTVHAFTISLDGELLVSVSKDFSIRVWYLTDEQFVPHLDNDEPTDEDIKQRVVINEANTEVMIPSNPTYISLKFTENIVEALDILDKEDSKDLGIDPHPILIQLKLSASLYVLHVLKNIPSTEIDPSLLILPYKYVIKLLNLICNWLKEGFSVELSSRCCIFLVKLHFYQIINTPGMDTLIEGLATHSKQQLNDIKDKFGVNLSWMYLVKRRIESQQSSSIFSISKPKTRQKKT